MRWLSSSLVVAALIMVSYGASAGFREDEIYCEEATARLAQCCPGFQTHTFECTYEDTSSSCDVHVQYPALDEDTSKCILALDCGSLVNDGVCDRAANVVDRVSQSRDDAGVVTSGGSTGVCK